MGDERSLSVEVALVVIGRVAVVVVIAKAAADDVGSDGIGKFCGKGPVVFLYGLFRLLVFTTQ